MRNTATHAAPFQLADRRCGVGYSAENEVRRDASDVLELRAAVAGVQLRERSERAIAAQKYDGARVGVRIFERTPDDDATVWSVVGAPVWSVIRATARRSERGVCGLRGRERVEAGVRRRRRAAVEADTGGGICERGGRGGDGNALR